VDGTIDYYILLLPLDPAKAPRNYYWLMFVVLLVCCVESEKLWQLLLQRDFGFQVSSGSSDEDWKRTLKVEKVSSSIMSIFGVDAARKDLVVETASAFESWKGWNKVSARFYRSEGRSEKSTSLVNAPYFLRAARFWQRIFQWCDDPHVSKTIGTRIRASLSERTGKFHFDWPAEAQQKKGLDACRAVYAFTGAQGSQLNAENTFEGLLGGYQAYSYYACTRLITPQVVSERDWGKCMVMVAMDPLSGHQRIQKIFMIDAATGKLEFRSDDEPEPAVNRLSPEADDFLVWLEEYANRLCTGQIGVGTMGDFHDPEAITQYPQFARGSAPLNNTEGVQTVSRAVTRGVEVIASAVYAPQGRNQFGFIYSIRIRLLTPEDGDYVTPSDRGFETCQLHSRHWRITDDSTGDTDQVNGEGVIGMYPLLREGGYTESGETSQGCFQYQSCTGEMSHGSFCGTIRFIPGSRNAPTGPEFAVEVRPFELNNRPMFLY
jgi:uncharacterized protein affecting Mg2+/Co2+ transport